MKIFTRYSLFLLLMMTTFFQSCAVIGGIFKAGVWVGILIVVVIVILLVMIFGRKNNG